VRERLRVLDTEIQNRDSQLCIIERGVGAVVAAIVYMYFRLGYDSVEVAEQLRLKSPLVHQVIWKLARLRRSSERIAPDV